MQTIVSEGHIYLRQCLHRLEIIKTANYELCPVLIFKIPLYCSLYLLLAQIEPNYMAAWYSFQ